MSNISFKTLYNIILFVLCAMSLIKIEFVDKIVTVYKIEKNGENWMIASPFIEMLNYSDCADAICDFVSPTNQKTFQELQSTTHHTSIHDLSSSSLSLPFNVQSTTKFINRAGVFELIGASKMPAAEKFKAWNANELLFAFWKDDDNDDDSNDIFKYNKQ
ncbi:Bro-e [Artaxa digramma nucleopolyhedrovirus]|uniref:Bro-e n=1 Tax=Artaxa digramma nucleopolyhedrovirus TaxID=3070910 RepID=A0AAE6R657_9ABAC|nr:Bro-e [Euproctis digramma nucleopolyhedrovirus]QHB21762.1 Bro-e [Artaxa digramma nucleopolyhedrovirus]